MKGVHTEIKLMCASLQEIVKQRKQDSIAISFVNMNEEASSQNLNQLEPSFMYTQIFKGVLLEVEYDEKSIKNFISYGRNGDYGISNNIDRFENDFV